MACPQYLDLGDSHGVSLGDREWPYTVRRTPISTTYSSSTGAVPADDGRREELRDKLAVGFRPVAENIARRYSGRGEPLDDLEQVASIGLLHALDRFQPDHGRELSGLTPSPRSWVRSGATPGTQRGR